MPEGLERSAVVHRLTEVWSKQESLILSTGLDIIFEIESRLIWVTAKIETAGIGVDVDALLEHHGVLTTKISALTAELERSIPSDIPLSDRTKIQAHLNSTYALSLVKIDEESVKWISSADVKRMTRILIDYWKATRERKNVETYISMTGADDRVRDSIEQLNTKTGRFYRPLQTVQKDGPMRSLFKAKEGYKFIVSDYSQQEARIIAGLSNDQVAIDLFKAGKDIYIETAKIIKGPNANGDWYRKLGKEIMLGLNNGRSAYSIFESFKMMGFYGDLDDVNGMIFKYNRVFPGIKIWWDEVASKAMNDGVISTMLIRSLKVSKDANINSLYNYPVQGTAADGFKLTLIYLEEQLADQNARVVHILHDEVIVEAKEEIVEALAITAKKCMERAFSSILPEVPFVVEPEIRDAWGD